MTDGPGGARQGARAHEATVRGVEHRGMASPVAEVEREEWIGPAGLPRLSRLQRFAGNRGVSSLLGERSRVAGGGARLQRCAACAAGRECETCAREERERLRRSPDASASVSAGDAAPPIVGDVLRTPGHPLDARTRGMMEAHFGQDLSGVRVHTDARAVESARAVEAHAYTVGQHLVFGAGRFAPETERGRGLLAHELTHAIQQRGASPGLQALRIDGGAGASVAEREAESAARSVMAARAPTLSHRSSVALRRVPTGKDDALGGCGTCLAKIPGGMQIGGSLVHAQVQAAAKLRYPYLLMDEIFNPGSDPKTSLEDKLLSLGVEALVGAAKKNADIPDLFDAVAEAPGAAKKKIRIGEIKPDNEKGRNAGLAQMKRYRRNLAKRREYKGATITNFREPLPSGIPFVLDPSRPKGCPTQKINVRYWKEGVHLYTCSPPFREQVKKKGCSCRKDDKKKAKPKGKAGNFGIGISIASSGGGAGNVGVSVSIKSSGSGYGTAGASATWDSHGNTVVGAGASAASNSSSNTGGGAGVTAGKDTHSTVAGGAALGTADSSTSLGAGVASKGSAKGSNVVAAGSKSSGEAKNVDATVAGSSGKGKASDVSVSGTGLKSDDTPHGTAGDAQKGGKPGATGKEGDEGGAAAKGSTETGGSGAKGGATPGEGGGKEAGDPTQSEDFKAAQEEAKRAEAALARATPAQRELLAGLAKKYPDHRLPLPEAEWIERWLTVTKDVKPEHVPPLLARDWEPPGTITPEEFKRAIDAVIAGKAKPATKSATPSAPVPKPAEPKPPSSPATETATPAPEAEQEEAKPPKQPQPKSPRRKAPKKAAAATSKKEPKKEEDDFRGVVSQALKEAGHSEADLKAALLRHAKDFDFGRLPKDEIRVLVDPKETGAQFGVYFFWRDGVACATLAAVQLKPRGPTGPYDMTVFDTSSAVTLDGRVFDPTLAGFRTVVTFPSAK